MEFKLYVTKDLIINLFFPLFFWTVAWEIYKKTRRPSWEHNIAASQEFKS